MVPSFDFVKDDCAVGSAVLGKREYSVSSTVSGAPSCKTNGNKFSELNESAAMGFSMVCVMLQAVYTTAEKEFRTIVFLIFWCLVLTQKGSHKSQKMKQHDISSSSL